MEKPAKKLKAKFSVSENAAAKPSSGITFEAFFQRCVYEGKLKIWQHKEIAAFFSDNKLREKEDLEVYEATLSKY